MRTIVLKLYQPSKTKQRIMDEAIINYNKAYQFLLKKAYQEAELIQNNYKSANGSYSANKLSKWVDKELAEKLNAFQVQPLKDSLKLELGMCLAGYYRLRELDRKTSFPKHYDITLFEHKSIEEIDNNNKLRPIYFCRYDTKRSYCLLYDRNKGKYYAKLYLLNKANAKPTTVPPTNSNVLQYIFNGFDRMESNRKREAYIIVPLAFGSYQEKYLKEALSKPSILRTAKLYKSGGDYYLAVSIEQEKPEKIQTETYLGVSRGAKNDLNYTVIDSKGQMLDTGVISVSGNINRLNILPDRLHIASNEVIRIALQNKSQVIVQNLTTVSDNLENPIYNCKDYINFSRILDYKLIQQGLPAPIKVSSSDLFQRCPECGCMAKKNRFTKDLFICIQCGASYQTEPLGSLNLARKIIKYRSDKIKIDILSDPEGILFTSKLLGLKCYIPNNVNQLQLLGEEINRRLKQLKNEMNDNNLKSKTRISILKKFEESGDLFDHIEFTTLKK